MALVYVQLGYIEINYTLVKCFPYDEITQFFIEDKRRFTTECQIDKVSLAIKKVACMYVCMRVLNVRVYA